MAESKNNIVTHGLSGKVGKLLVFSNRAGKTVVSSVPRKRTGEPTEAQKAHQRRFQQAVIYGKEVQLDAEKKELYKPATTVTVDDNFMVSEVTLTILNDDGTEVESGNAQPSPTSNRKWTYTAVAANSNLSGDKIIITAFDLPGNITKDESVLQ